MTTADTYFDNGAGQRTSSAQLGEQAKQAASDLKDNAADLADSVAQTAKQEAAKIGAAATEMLHDASDKVKSAVSEQKAAGADYLDTVARAIHRAAREFEADVPQAAHYIRRAGGQVSSVASAVRQGDLRDLVAEVEEAARRQPALFFGGALVLGFVALRFLKSAPASPVQVNN